MSESKKPVVSLRPRLQSMVLDDIALGTFVFLPAGNEGEPLGVFGIRASTVLLNGQSADGVVWLTGARIGRFEPFQPHTRILVPVGNFALAPDFAKMTMGAPLPGQLLLNAEEPPRLAVTDLDRCGKGMLDLDSGVATLYRDLPSGPTFRWSVIDEFERPAFSWAPRPAGG